MYENCRISSVHVLSVQILCGIQMNYLLLNRNKENVFSPIPADQAYFIVSLIIVGLLGEVSSWPYVKPPPFICSCLFLSNISSSHVLNLSSSLKKTRIFTLTSFEFDHKVYYKAFKRQLYIVFISIKIITIFYDKLASSYQRLIN